MTERNHEEPRSEETIDMQATAVASEPEIDTKSEDSEAPTEEPRLVDAPETSEVTGWHPGMPDRRTKPTPMLSKYWLRGRRKGNWSGDRGDDSYVDRYQASEWFLVVGVLMMSIFDMLLTLDVVGRGAEEANPLMKAALDGGPFWFAGVKITVTIGCLLFALTHIRFKKSKALLMTVFCAYGLLMAYHMYIQVRLGS